MNAATALGRAKFRFPIPFDPIRLLGGVLSRWPWILAGVLSLASIGVLFGIKITHQSFSVTVSLIKRRVPQTVQASDVGEAYRPVDLNDATLLATLLASEPLDKAMKRVQNGIDPDRAKSLVQATQLEGTDIFYITYHSPISPQDAVRFGGIWAEEIEAYTQQLQRTEAHGVRLILQKEVTELENQSSATNAEILNFSKEKDYFGGESQVSAALSKLSLIELQLETARATAASKNSQLKSLKSQIQRQSPIELQLKTANEELANLRATYTDANPLVQTKLQSIDYLSKQVDLLAARKQEETNLDSYTGTPLGNQIFLNILALQDQLFEANSQIASLEKLRTSTTARISEFPGIIGAYEALKTKRNAISEGLSMMTNRLKEAEIFASGAPGYWQVFQAPDIRSITPSSLVSKPAISGIAGAFLGGGITTILTLLLSQRSQRRSTLECCIATTAPLITAIPASSSLTAQQATEHFWITYLAPRLRTSENILFWTSALEPENERQFWNLLSEAAMADSGNPFIVHDLTPDQLWNDSSQASSLDWKTELAASGVIRASVLPHGPARDLLASTNQWIAVVSGTKKSITLAAKSQTITAAYLPPCAGTIAWMESAEGPIRKAADLLSLFLTKHFS
jgi:uncharacterized protein involved in exopolysaccharide biosynthesis